MEWKLWPAFASNRLVTWCRPGIVRPMPREMGENNPAGKSALEERDILGTQGIEPEGRTFARIPRYHLTIVSGPDSGTKYTTSGERTGIGTHKSTDLVLSDRTVSRFHCEILISDAQVSLRDLGSRNGTRVNGVSVVEAHLEHGSVIAIGRTQIHVEFSSDHVDVPLSTAERFGRMVGKSKAMRGVFALLERAAQTESTVLMLGETGVGKDAAAESIHISSARNDKPLVVVDCGAIHAGLLESELFGHEKGAFTGADRTRVGAFEAASGGTLFLDEVGELSLDLQPKLLRVLDRHEVQRVGSTERFPVDVRVVAATNVNLQEEVNAGNFRSDLYYRLAVLEIRVPPLRERLEDVPLLVQRFINDMDPDSKNAALAMATEAFYADLTRHSWPGNVRELRNYLERCLALGSQAPLARGPAQGDPPNIDFDKPLFAVRDHWLRFLERRYLEEQLRRHTNNITAAAKSAGVDRTSFYRLLTRCGLR